MMFYNNAGIILRRSGDLRRAVLFYNQVLEILRQLKMTEYEARIHNNLAFIYTDQQKFGEAHASADKSLKLFLAAGNSTGIPIICDSKALIYLAEGKFSAALKSAEMAVHYFSEGEDYQALTEAMWTKTLCLLRLDRIEEALDDFVNLQTLAAQRIGAVAVKKFKFLLKEQIYVPGQNDLSTEVAVYKKSLVKKGLIKSGLRITKAAKILGLNSHTNVQKILENQFPELYDELQMPRPIPRKPSTTVSPDMVVRNVEIYQPKPIEHIRIIKRRDILQEKVATQVHFQKVHFSFRFDYDASTMKTFHFNKQLMKNFGFPGDAFIAIAPLEGSNLKDGIILVVKSDDRFHVGTVICDEFSKVYFLNDDEGHPIILDEDNIIGVPVGYCPGSEGDKPIIEFSRLKIAN